MRCRNAHITVLIALAATGASLPSRADDVPPSPCKPEVWKAAIEKFEAEDAKNPPPQGAVVFVGSSSVRLWNLAKSFPDLAAINRGFGGSQICHSTHYADQLVVKHQPRMVVLYAGDNDVAAGKSPEQVHGDFRAFVAKVRKGLPETPIVFVAIKPSIARWKMAETMQAANRLIAADCEKDETLRFLDVWTPMLGDDGRPRKELFRQDGLHLNDAGYELWNELLRPLLKVEEDNHDGTTDTTDATKRE
jgi:lysophospholipase L1-like esterase